MSERSERIIESVLFAAQRRIAHWCLVEIDEVAPPPESMVHQ